MRSAMEWCRECANACVTLKGNGANASDEHCARGDLLPLLPQGRQAIIATVMLRCHAVNGEAAIYGKCLTFEH